MSVFANVQATPSRMLGLLRLLAVQPNQSATQTELGNLWWPRVTRPDSASVNYFGDNMRELLAAGLIEEEENKNGETAYRLGASIPEQFRSPDGLVEHGPGLFLQHLLGDGTSERNDDLGYVLAWWLAQPLVDVPPTPSDIATEWRSVIDVEAIPWRSQDGDPLAVNEDRARQMRLWAVYFGLGWEHGPSARRTPELQPDPTRLLRRVLKGQLPEDGTEERVDEVWGSVAAAAPFLDKGGYSMTLQEVGVLETEEGRSFSQSVSMALLRLEDEGFLRLIASGDAGAAHQRLLTWGSRRPITHLALNAVNTN